MTLGISTVIWVVLVVVGLILLLLVAVIARFIKLWV